MQFELYKEGPGAYHYRLIGNYLRSLIRGGLTSEKEKALKDIEQLRSGLASGRGIELKSTELGMHYFEVKNKNGRTVGSSGLYTTTQALLKKLRLLRSKIGSAPVVEKAD